MKLCRRWGTALVGAGLVVLSCSADRGSVTVEANADASTSTVSTSTVLDSPVAAMRIAELRARFRLPVRGAEGTTRPALGSPVARSFESAAGADAATHVRAVLPTEALHAVMRAARIALPVRSTDEVKLEDETSHLSLRFALDHVKDARVEVAGGMALYRGALDGADVVHRVHAEGTEDFVVFEKRPAREELSYSVDVSRVPGLRLVSNTLEFLDDTGTPLLRVAPPYVVDAKGARHDAKLSVSGCAYDTSPAGPWGRKVTKPGAERCSVRVAWAGDVAYPAMVDPAWSATGSMVHARLQHTATVLASGKVLVTGGDAGGVPASGAELFDDAGIGGVGTFAATGSPGTWRLFHTASLLLSGKVLVAGGEFGGAPASAELYDPGAGTFASTGSPATARARHTASVLASGKVLVAGGTDPGGGALASAELFDPAGAGTFTATGSLATARASHTASVLLSGKVLVAGGNGSGIPSYLASAELFDSAGAGTFAATGSMGTWRRDHTASVLPSGKVLVVGGVNTAIIRNAELYDAAGNSGAGSFAATGLTTDPRFGHTASVLPSGKVLVAGGLTGGGGYLATAELYDPAGNLGAGVFAVTIPMAIARGLHTASVLPSGKVLVAGGNGPTVLGSAELLGDPLGDACATNERCLSGFCADGVCCNSACSGGGCDRCDLAGKEGTCSVAPVGNPGANPACALPYACDGVHAVCASSCVSDAACAPAYYCAPSGTCQPRKTQGSACDAKADCKESGCRECASGFCVDGVCCDAACDGLCLACVAALKQNGVADGTCGPSKNGLDPDNECSPDGSQCGADGQCNGTGACRAVTPAGVSCASDGKVCDGSGTCARPPFATCIDEHTSMSADGKTQDCAPHKCESNGTCRSTCTSVNDCVTPTVCDATGKCVAPPEDTGSGGGCTLVRARAGDARAQTAWLAVVAGLALLRGWRRRGEKAVSS